MFLEYGVDTNGTLVHISQSPQGRVSLNCPYCGRSLIARKGQQLEHHFAHDGETCRDASRDFAALDLPLYDRFHLHLSPRTWEALQRFHNDSYFAGDTRLLLDAELLTDRFTQGKPYVLTTEGKVPFGEASAPSFSAMQDRMVEGRHDRLTLTVENAYFGRHIESGIWNYYPRKMHWTMLPNREMVSLVLTDLNIYRQQVYRAYSKDLYLLHIIHSTGDLHKIGVTTRDIDTRIEEVRRDLRGDFDVRSIEVIRLLKWRGAVERYLHHRYHRHRVPVGTHLEYFNFDKQQRRNILSEYTKLGDYEPTRTGLISILQGELSPVEQSIIKHRELVDKAHEEALYSDTVRVGMIRAKEKGHHVGRPSDDRAKTLAKFSTVVDALQQGMGIRQTAAATGVAINTVRKVKKLLDQS